MPSEVVQVLFRVLDALERLGIPYVVGGSVASGAHGEPRSTNDADVLIDLRPERIEDLVAALSPEFYIDRESVREAIALKRSFNVIHLKLFLKADLFVAGDGLLDREQMERRALTSIAEDDPRQVYVTSPELIVLRKLDWYRIGGGVSDRQWRDILAVLKNRREDFDFDYLRRTASRLGLVEPLERALREAG